jgi:hypothetical protein
MSSARRSPTAPIRFSVRTRHFVLTIDSDSSLKWTARRLPLSSARVESGHSRSSAQSLVIAQCALDVTPSR